MELPALDFAWLGTRGIVGVVMLIHMIFAQLFVGYVIASPLLQNWGGAQGKRPHAAPRYIMILIMVLATLGATIAYVRGRRLFRYGNASPGYRAVLLLVGLLAVALTMDMGYMKSNSRVPYTVYGESQYTVKSERPITQQQIEP